MPIAAAMPTLQTQINNSLSLGQAANSQITALMITSAVASAVPMGLFPAAPAPFPLTPAGFSAGKTMIENAFKLDKAANTDTVSMMLASGISLIAPMAPPAGLSYLQSQIKNAFSLDKAANAQTISMIMATAIPQYYMMGGII